MTIAAGTNCFTQAEDAIVSLVVKSPKARLFLGAANESAARGRVFLDEVPQTDKLDSDDWDQATYLGRFPCAIVSQPADSKWFHVRQAARDVQVQYDLDFLFAVRFEMLANPAIDEQQQLRTLKNQVFDAVTEMLENTINEPGVFVPTRIEPIELYRLDFRNRVNLGHIIGTALLFVREVQQ